MENKSHLPFDYPMQPTFLDNHGILRFVRNPIVQHLLDHGMATGCCLNTLAIKSKELGFTDNDWRHFSQLHGYSLGGFCDLSFVSDAEDGYYEYLEQQVPEYFNPDEADNPSDEANCLTAIETLANTIKQQAIDAANIQRILQDQLDEQTTRADKVTEELGQLKTIHNNILESKHVFHECDGKIRTYPALCCSMARGPGDHTPDDDFDAKEKIIELQDRVAELEAEKAIWLKRVTS